MFECAHTSSRFLRQSLAVIWGWIGAGVYVRYWQDHRIHALDAGWTAEKLDQVWAVRHAFRLRVEPSLVHLWAVLLAAIILFLLTFFIAGVALYRASELIHCGHSVM
ncbi:hypothetical protein HNQ40_003272 [Algisphaera agarilytica]|uniref:Uncharacterized protein n=2 Tax=Algisphaera agarilytica TaxID=1385975 RepID=A0A7X0HB42_9BACT|nr:hypothetical protein [Algisphaera agarilytica]